MADGYRLRDTKFQNFVSCYLGFAFVGTTLAPYTRSVLQRIHQTIYARLAREADCVDQCSLNYGNQTGRWCRTCTQWRKQLQRFSRKRLNKFEGTRSWEWPRNYISTIEIFAPAYLVGEVINLKDIPSVTSIWKQCDQFNIQRASIDRVKRLRNKAFGHNPELSVDNDLKAEVFDALKNIVSHPEFNASIHVQSVIQKLNSLEIDDQQDEYIKSLETKIDQQGQRHEDNQHVILLQLNETVSQMEALNENQHKLLPQLRKFVVKPIAIVMKNSLGMLLLVLAIIYVLHIITTYGLLKWNTELPNQEQNHSNELSGCLSENYTFPIRQDLPLYGYLPAIKIFTGRQWLFHELGNSLLDINSDKVGSFVIADIGFGKSAIVSHILCANESSSVFFLRRHIVAFHVCKSDVPSTHLPGRFIRRLVGFFSMKSEEFGNIIAMLDNSSLIYDQDKCGLEFRACFDQGIVLPLSQMTAPDEPWVIIIDALDECFDDDNNKNALFDIFVNRIRRLPKWLRLLVTSRNIPHSLKLKKIKYLFLNTNDTSNLNDIKEYVQIKLLNGNIKDDFSSNQLSEKVNRFVNLSEGNFMFITHVLNYISEQNIQSFNYDELPSSLNELYEMNFERQFPTTDSFKIPRKILEVIIASLNPLNKGELFKIINRSIKCTENDFKGHIQKLSYFLSFMKDISFVHRSIYEWLKTNESEQFRISLKKGHKMISQYLLSQANYQSVSHDHPVNLVVHVAKSQDISLRKMLGSLIHSKEIQLTTPDVRNLISLTDSVVALKFIFQYIHYSDEINEFSFVAAQTGHLEQLRYLGDLGADIGLTLSENCSPQSVTLDSMTRVDCLVNHGLLHVAALYDHSAIVKYLLEKNSSLLYVTNSDGLKASDIACNKGHISVLDIMFKYNESLLDDVCLYYAVKYDYSDIVKSIIKNEKFKLKCITENKSRESFKRSNIHSTTDKDNYVNSIADWWNVLKRLLYMLLLDLGII